MKKIFFCILFTASCYTFAQDAGLVLSRGDFADGSTFSNRIRSKTGKDLTYEDVTGSPYSNVNFLSAKIADNYEKTPVRYNSYTDQIEFQRDNKVMILPEETQFSRIEIISPKQTLVLLDTKDDLSGYFFEIVKGKYSLYKKQETKFIDAEPASNSYTSEKPAYFKQSDPVYYISINDAYIKSPKNQKEILAQFPDKKEALNSFFKENKIKFNKEEDLKKLVNFLNQ
ncbi:MAG: hypothetical protein DI622_01345 [Chryseobacterium sp.]|uniref:hypothetical protein n=1 Tax=Chryseobacterium sp. TaxID=1871047 RepID=UPI000DB4B8CA|nr:hypothetical protein [Chryseobacterium sp.]MPS63271.1 hypothetical protein [Chryseobacterium sp.]PZU26203.1 MAG: hypothetical protein DI622_01345 [Chryseobacterium sp.]